MRVRSPNAAPFKRTRYESSTPPAISLTRYRAFPEGSILTSVWTLPAYFGPFFSPGANRVFLCEGSRAISSDVVGSG